jgi:hypothetical protein
MNSVGIDLHRNRSHVAVIDGQGELSLSRRIVNDRATFLELLAGLEGESQIAVERPTAGSGWRSCSRTPATRSISRIRCARGRSPRRG